jgi:Asp-tRNA(Asn)/Glu-tRNA(Gln) amidotransferase A subunit family amidase
MIGVGAFGYVLLHFLLYAASQGFNLDKVASEIWNRIYLTIGFTALLVLAALAARLAADGIDTETIDLPFPLADFRELQKELCYWEAARLLLATKRKRIVPELEALLGPYLERDLSDYAAARRRREAYQAQFAALVTKMDAILLPAATGVAPPLADTGDAVMSRFWTALHVPALSVPLWRRDDGLPLGLQLLGALGNDRALAAVGQWFFDQG